MDILSIDSYFTSVVISVGSAYKLVEKYDYILVILLFILL